MYKKPQDVVKRSRFFWLNVLFKPSQLNITQTLKLEVSKQTQSFRGPRTLAHEEGFSAAFGGPRHRVSILEGPSGVHCTVPPMWLELGCPNFASKKVSLQSKTQRNANGFAWFRLLFVKLWEKYFASFCFVLLQKFRFVRLKNMFRFKVWLWEQFRFKSFASFH